MSPPEWPVSVPWSNGFEDGFCGYAQARGYCYRIDTAEYTLVESPVHAGLRAARFFVTTTDANANQTRCVREGVLPTDATYGAWYYLPDPSTAASNWNLFLFQSVDPNNGNLTPLWDVTLGVTDDGHLRPHIFPHPELGVTIPDLPDPPVPSVAAVPIGAWFHLAFRWKRAESGGVVELYQSDENGDDILIHSATGIQTDFKGSPWGQWYVGNLIGQKPAADSTVYVDDVTIRPSHH